MSQAEGVSKMVVDVTTGTKRKVILNKQENIFTSTCVITYVGVRLVVD